MSDVLVAATEVEKTFREIAAQAEKLGKGLQQAAPGSVSGVPNQSVEYLLTISKELTLLAEECQALQSTSTNKPTLS